MHWATGFHLTPRQANGLEGADVLLAQTAAETVIADKGYAPTRAMTPKLECSNRFRPKAKALSLPHAAAKRRLGTTTRIFTKPAI